MSNMVHLPNTIRTDSTYNLNLKNDRVIYHTNVLTGITSQCFYGDNCYLEEKFHYYHKIDAETYGESIIISNLYDYSFSQMSEEFLSVLEIATSLGFHIAEDYSDIAEAQINILSFCEGLVALEKLLKSDEITHSFMYKVIEVIAWALKKYATNNGLEVKDALENIYPNFPYKYANNLKIALNYNHVSREDLLKVSSALWMFNYSPLQSLAKFIIYDNMLNSPEFSYNTDSANESIIPGYVPSSDFHIEYYNNSDYKKNFTISDKYLLDGIIAIDVEMDTSKSLGLRPVLSQITEIVISCKNYTRVISGDEKRILEEFARFMNTQKNIRNIVGWNNNNFDNIVLQTRAELHSLSSWHGYLKPVDNQTIFTSVGPQNISCNLLWNNHDKNSPIESIDVFQMKAKYDNKFNNPTNYLGLKDFVSLYDATPLKVDRSKMHLLTPIERSLYSLSDGMSTLMSYGIMLQDFSY